MLKQCSHGFLKFSIKTTTINKKIKNKKWIKKGKQTSCNLSQVDHIHHLGNRKCYPVIMLLRSSSYSSRIPLWRHGGWIRVLSRSSGQFSHGIKVRFMLSLDWDFWYNICMTHKKNHPLLMYSMSPKSMWISLRQIPME